MEEQWKNNPIDKPTGVSGKGSNTVLSMYLIVRLFLPSFPLFAPSACQSMSRNDEISRAATRHFISNSDKSSSRPIFLNTFDADQYTLCCAETSIDGFRCFNNVKCSVGTEAPGPRLFEADRSKSGYRFEKKKDLFLSFSLSPSYV